MAGWPKPNTHTKEIPSHASTHILPLHPYTNAGSKPNQAMDSLPSKVYSISEERNLEKGGYNELNKSTMFTKYLPFWIISDLICKACWDVFRVFDSPLAFCKPTSLWDSNPVTITLSYKTLFCWCSNCLTWLPGLNSCSVCKSVPRMHLTITFLSTETAPWQKMYFKNDFLFFAFKTKACKSNGSWEQQHMLTIMITIRGFSRTEGRERGPVRGSTKALKNSRECGPRRVGYSWVMGETWLWKDMLVTLQTLEEMLRGQNEKCWQTKPSIRDLLSVADWRSPSQKASRSQAAAPVWTF